MTNSDQEIIRALRELKAVQPSPSFVARGRKQFGEVRSWSAPRWIFAGVSVAVVIVFFTLLPAALPFSRAPEALSAEVINRELDNLSLNVQLKELRYEQDESINSALREITNIKNNHLNPKVLKDESSLSSPVPDLQEDQINQLLDQVINR